MIWHDLRHDECRIRRPCLQRAATREAVYYALLDERVPPTKALERNEALAEPARRFLSRGPATVHDFAKWSGLRVTDARTGPDNVKDYFECEIVDGKEYWLYPSNEHSFRRLTTAHLLSVYYENFSGYKDRTAVINREDYNPPLRTGQRRRLRRSPGWASCRSLEQANRTRCSRHQDRNLPADWRRLRTAQFEMRVGLTPTSSG